MAGMTEPRLRAIRNKFAPDYPAIFCETGTFRGERSALATALFPTVYTVEISGALYEGAKARFPDLGIHFVRGDSRDAVRLWAREFAAPVCWFLDAHWFDLNRTKTQAGARRALENPVGGKENPFPLWDELTVIAARPYADIIIVDDIHDFGTDRTCPDWATASVDKVNGYFPTRREAAVLGDQAVVWR